MKKSGRKAFSLLVIVGLLTILLVGATVNSTAAGKVTRTEAKRIVLEHAGVKAENVLKWKIKKDYDDGILVYEIDFKTKNYKYDYEINARTGKIFEHEKEYFVSVDAKYIGIDKAKAIALKDAGITGSVSYTKAKLDKDDGVYVYDVEFRYGSAEYEYEIDAKTGKILDRDKDFF
ncbi:MAG: PepSY domain-containing protein [Lachnospiraceae bacterium]